MRVLKRHRFPTNSLWRGGYARGVVVQGDELYMAADMRIAVLDARSLALRRFLLNPRFGDLHGMIWHEGQLMVVNTLWDEVVAVDPHTGASTTVFRLPAGVHPRCPAETPRDDPRDPERHHLNSITADGHGWLVTAHGRLQRAAVWSVQDGIVRPVWLDGPVGPLREPHDARRIPGGMLVHESLAGRLLFSEGQPDATARR